MTPEDAEAAVRGLSLTVKEMGLDNAAVLVGFYMGLSLAHRRPEAADAMRAAYERLNALASGKAPEEIERLVDVAAWVDAINGEAAA